MSYADADFGVEWARERLEDYVGSWCMVVDADEFIEPSGTLKDEMDYCEANGYNVIPTCLVEFYPDEIRKPYDGSEPPHSHSNLFDGSQNCFS